MKIKLQNMQFFARHGLFAEERENGNTFLVHIELILPEVKGCKTDCIDDTLNYQYIYDIVKEEMERPSDLLEHITYRIKERIHTSFPEITTSLISVSKKNPPLGGKVEWVSIEL